MDKFVVSLMRFSTAMTLFGLEQVQGAVTSMGSGEDLTTSMEKMRQAMDAFSETVLKQVDEGKRETAETVTRVSEDTIRRAFAGVSASMADPRELVRVTTDMVKKTSDSVVHWMEGRGTAQTAASEEPQPAAEALGDSAGTKAKAKAS